MANSTEEAVITTSEGGALIGNTPLKYYHGAIATSEGDTLADADGNTLTFAYIGEKDNG